MPERLLQLDDICTMTSAANVAKVFYRLGYNTHGGAQPLAVADLELPARSAEAIWDAHLIADQSRSSTSSLQVLLFQLHADAWETPSTASNRMRSIAQNLCRRPSKFLLLGTKNYDQLMLVNPRTSLDAQMNVKTSIRKLLIDRAKPTAYDRDRLEALAAHNLDPQALYNRQCDAFDVEKLTKEFYKGYKEIFEQVQRVIREHNPHPYFEDASRLHQCSQRLLGRVMFLYFLQKKEFLGSDRDFLKNQYRRLKPEPEDTDFYTTLLEPLFFEMLNKERPNFASPWGKIPYLNGGLFDRDYGEDVIDAAGLQTPDALILPNSLFDPSGEKGIIKFFNGYNFTISENVQGDEDVAVDPEMLGKVFENMLAADERGQSGTFYTPRGIVHFMCVESLSRYLADESGVALEVVKQLAEYETELPDADLKKLLSKDQTRKLKQALESVKVCDPAVGSGAFPLGMMQVILSVYQAIGQREGESLKRGSLAMSRLKRKIIANNLYGVDIKPEAIEIAKLRMWLSMVVDIPTLDDVEPLPNLDYKLMAGNSLISTIAGEHLIPDPTKTQQGMLNVTPVQAAIQPLLALQNQYFESHAGDRQALSKQIREAEAAVFQAAIVDRRQYWQGEQRRLEQDIERMGKASKAQTQKLQAVGDKLKELDSVEIDVARGLRSLDFFQWHLHFNDVFQQKGGFDVVIGNPPYVRQEKLSEQFKGALKTEFPDLFNGRADIYTYFYGHALNLLKTNGKISFISSNKSLKSGYCLNLRKYITKACQICSITDFGELPVFEAATFPMIFIGQKTKSDNYSFAFTQVTSLDRPYPNIQEIIHKSSNSFTSSCVTRDNWGLSNNNTSTPMQSTESHLVSLSDYVNGEIYWGVKTGLNEAFIIDNLLRKGLIEELPACEKLIKPLVVGDNIRKWRIDYQDKWLIYTPHGVDISGLEPVEKHLRKYQEKLERRATRQNWYELQQPQFRYSQAFSSSKIVFPDIAKESRFTLDRRGYFTLNTTYFIPSSDLYLLGVLNSSTAWNYCKEHLTVLGDANKGGRLRFFCQFVEKIPIPRASPHDHQTISALVQRCLDARGQDVAHWEAEINDRVAHLYGLTSEEIKIIEGGQN